jgi:hypothetical protein
MSEDNGKEEEGQETQTDESQTDVGGDGQQPSKSEAKSYSEEELQDALNRIVPERLQRKEQSIFKDLGVKDADEAKELFSQLKKLKLEQMSEQERQQALLKDAEERAERLQAERDQAIIESQDRMLKAAFLAEAGRRGAKHPGDAFRLADLSSVKVDGEMIEGVEDAVQALIDNGRLPLVGKQSPPPLDGGAGGGERPGKKVKLSLDQVAHAEKMGVSPEEYAKNLEG